MLCALAAAIGGPPPLLSCEVDMIPLAWLEPLEVLQNFMLWVLGAIVVCALLAMSGGPPRDR